MQRTLEQIRFGMDAEFSGDPAQAAAVATGYSIDSRTIAAGDLFFAIHGERLNGHDYVDAALAAGAVAAVVARQELPRYTEQSLRNRLLVVEDTLRALQGLAHDVRRHWGKRLIAITGSAGKTTTKEAIAQVLGARYCVRKSQGNLNNGYGLPLQLLRLQAEDEIAVMEMGMSQIGEIAALAKIAAPDWGVVTNVGVAHAENFSDGQAGIARAKFELVAALPANGVAFLNCDDPYVSQFGRNFLGRTVYFGVGPCADPQIVSVGEDLDGLHVRYRSGDRTGSFTLKLLGAHNASNAAAALAVAIEAGVDLGDAVAALTTLTAGDKRGEVMEINGATILNDCYNSNPEALRSMIGTLARRPAGRRILMAGEMLELGGQSAELHAACGRAAAEAGLDFVAAVQGNAAHLAAAACAGGVASLFLPDAEAAGQWLRRNLQPGDTILIKGSRGVHLERAIEALQEPVL